MGKFDREIRIIREHCYKANIMDLSETTMINKALDVAIECMRKAEAYDKAREEITDAIGEWMDIDNGKCRGLYLAECIIAHYVDEGGEYDRN